MTKIFETTKEKAISAAKEILRTEYGVKRLSYTHVKDSRMQCDCGESYAVEVTAKIKGNYYDVTVGVCERCANN